MIETAPELPEGHLVELAELDAALVRGGAREVEPHVVGAEVDLPVVLELGIDGVNAASLKPEGDRHGLRIRDQRAPGGDDRARLVDGALVVEEHPLHRLPADGDPIRVDHDPPEVVVENLFLDPYAGLLLDDRKQEVLRLEIAPGDEEETGQGRQAGGNESRRHDRGSDPVEAQAAGPEDRELVVPRKTADPDQDGDDEGQGDREQHKRGHQVEDQPKDLRKGDPLVDHKIDEAQDAAHDEHEGENKKGHEEGVEDFPEDVSIQDAEHGRVPSQRFKYQFFLY